MRHAIPQDYNTIDRRELQEEIAGKIDKSFTMCAEWVNNVRVLAEANFAHVREKSGNFISHSLQDNE